jgi:hypothetical protein
MDIKYYQIATRLDIAGRIFTGLYGPKWIKRIIYAEFGYNIADKLLKAKEFRDDAGKVIDFSPKAICASDQTSLNGNATEYIVIKSGDPPGGFPDQNTVKNLFFTISGESCPKSGPQIVSGGAGGPGVPVY